MKKNINNRLSLKSKLRKAGNFFKSSFDRYGEPIGFEIEGSSKFTTYLGAFISLFILLLTGSYSYERFFVMKDYEDSNHLSIVEPMTDVERLYSQSETQLNVAIGLYNAESWTPNFISSYGYLEPKFQIQSWEPVLDDAGRTIDFDI